MKKNDIALIILIVSITLMVAFFIGKALIGTPASNPTKVEVVQPISASFTPPSSAIFNDTAVNPTETINIGNSNKEQPFSN
jgi:hypothetical protein